MDPGDERVVVRIVDLAIEGDREIHAIGPRYRQRTGAREPPVSPVDFPIDFARADFPDRMRADESGNRSVVELPVVDPSRANEILILNLPSVVHSDSDNEKPPCEESETKEAEATPKSQKKKVDKPKCSEQI